MTNDVTLGNPGGQMLPAGRPGWVYAVAAVYLLLLAGCVSIPVIFMGVNSNQNDRMTTVLETTGIVAGFLVCGALLIAVPARAQWQLPNAQRAIWLPLIGSVLLLAVLCFAAGVATIELISESNDAFVVKVVFWMVGAIWLIWTSIFWFMSRSLNPPSMSVRAYKAVLAGSVLELVVAVPMHLIVRRREECCAGLETGFAICLGALTAVVALGPGVFFLYHRRWNEVYGGRRGRKLGG